MVNDVVTIESADLDKLAKVFAKVETRLSSDKAKDFWALRALDHSIDTTANFILKGNGKYDPLTPEYKARKDKAVPGTPILTGVDFKKKKVSGRLKLAVSGRKGPTKDTILKVSKKGFERGTDLPYAGFVQDVRPYLFLSKAYIKRTIRNIEEFIIAPFK